MPQRGVLAERRAGELHGIELPRDVVRRPLEGIPEHLQRADAQAYVSLWC